MSVITLSRQFGSRGDHVALAVAERLRLRLVGRELINRAAGAAGAPEVALAEIDELGLLGIRPSPEAHALYLQKVRDVVVELATAGNVLLVGRGSQVILSDWGGVLHVRIIAPKQIRSAVVQAGCHVPPEVAMARIEASDRARTSYLWRHHHQKLDDPLLYDLVLNLAHLDEQTATDLICCAAERSFAARQENPL